MCALRRKGKPLIINKEDGLFREALTLYDKQEYKKALKILDGLTKKSPNHAESFALKGLALHYTGAKDEAESYVKKSLAKNEKNPVVNHIAGLYYRAVSNYKEAAKWYAAAIANGSTNKNILKDLSTAQSQIRDYKNLPRSRLDYLEDQPGFRANWTAAAVAHHLNKDYKAAEKVLNKIDELIASKLREEDYYEHSECLLYKNSIITESGDYEHALEDLLEIEKSDKVFDKLSLLEYKAKLYLLLGKKKESSLIYRQLLKVNPDCSHYYYLLDISLDTVNSSTRVRKALYEKLAKFYPKSDPPKYIPLTFLNGDEFIDCAKPYILNQLKRGVPSTFVNVKPLYKNSLKREAILKIVLEFFENEAEEVSPLTWCWTAYFLSQHYYYVKDYENSLKYINKAIEHTPTLVELYIVKARIFKRLNKLDEAAEIMNEGRLIDLQDRFINARTTKYYLRANNVDKAVETVSLFSKTDDENVNCITHLHTMQCNWFIIEAAECYYRLHKSTELKLKDLKQSDFEDEADYLSQKRVLEEQVNEYMGLSMKRFLAINKVYEDYYLDQVDFHSYCMRKGTPRTYMNMMEWADKLYHQPIYTRAISGVSKILFDILNEKKKLQKLAEKESESGVQKKDKKTKRGKKSDMKRIEQLIKETTAYSKDEDPLGTKFIEKINTSKNPIEKIDFIKYFDRLDKDLIETNIILFKSNFELGKFVLSLSSLNKIITLTKDTHPIITPFFLQLKLSLQNESIPSPINKIINVGLLKNFKEFMTITDSNELINTLITKYFEKSLNSFETGVAIIETVKLLDLMSTETVDFESVTSKLNELLASVKKNIDPYSSGLLEYYL
ncbi:hypothetical protein B5S28_g3828 [[Candida] boidinii]|nr:hypothetical protein B5S28_g3828 [[Candida] boidinii]OWB63366.1 hypothetical protein B5S29_g4341 [[Candida] boidinii]